MLYVTLTMAALVHAVEAGNCDRFKHHKAVNILITKYSQGSHWILRREKPKENPAVADFEVCPDESGECEDGFFCTKKDEEGKCKKDGRCIADEEEAGQVPYKAGKASRKAAAMKAIAAVFGPQEDDILWNRCVESGFAVKHKFERKAAGKGAEEPPEEADEVEGEGDAGEETEDGDRQHKDAGKKKKADPPGLSESHMYWLNVTEGTPDFGEDFAGQEKWFVCDGKTKKDADHVKKGKFDKVKQFLYADIFRDQKVASTFQCPNMGGGGKKSSSGSGVVFVVVIVLLLMLAGAGSGIMMMQKNRPLMPPISTAQLMESQEKTIEMSLKSIC